ncbi:hypothetical protein ABAZ39_14710 (plasmid) [Azospirillum argentinense]|uniref:Uncharacterized protein n=1 Tax=Azospirillum argentinense TaxID=2970906 RepID=A0A060DJV3_9PROT|nr:hypothetical protein ABAZ39_14710 [Azospirillum argentinense]EZQ06394.1 hypothetical protein ABAZ39_14875 [Azospirillum argentinense]
MLHLSADQPALTAPSDDVVEGAHVVAFEADPVIALRMLQPFEQKLDAPEVLKLVAGAADAGNGEGVLVLGHVASKR